MPGPRDPFVTPYMVPFGRAIAALTAGSAGNLTPGVALSPSAAIAGVESAATVVLLVGGTDEEGVEALRDRVLFRLQRPPMGGDADDYVA